MSQGESKGREAKLSCDRRTRTGSRSLKATRDFKKDICKKIRTEEREHTARGGEGSKTMVQEEKMYSFHPGYFAGTMIKVPLGQDVQRPQDEARPPPLTAARDHSLWLWSGSDEA